jgi:hypothetical protein
MDEPNDECPRRALRRTIAVVVLLSSAFWAAVLAGVLLFLKR